jgi:hypothetical protein
MNVSLADEHVDDVTIPTQVIEYDQNFLQTDWNIQIKLCTINLVFQVTLKYGDILYENVTQQCYNYICVRVLIPLFKPGMHCFPLVYVQIDQQIPSRTSFQWRAYVQS